MRGVHGMWAWLAHVSVSRWRQGVESNPAQHAVWLVRRLARASVEKG